MNPSGTPSKQFTSIGGQAVIEGVMMRSPHFVAVAVRRPDRKIIIKNLPYSSVMDRFPVLKKPVFRGVTTLLESMFQGIDALSWSANASSAGEGEGEGLSSLAIAGSILSAFVIAIALFVALPHGVTALITSSSWMGISAQSPIFHLIDGVLKMLVLISYVYAIALMKDIRRVFQYHGAEHKSIYAFEKGEELTVENARRHSRLHPRCGTSFLLFLVLISIAVFSIVFPLFGLTQFSTSAVLNHLAMIGVKTVLMMPVAGLAYEFIKMCACRMDNSSFWRALIWPGLVLQNLTTREPDDEQLEVALASLRQVLRLEKGAKLEPEAEITGLSELGMVAVSVAEFPEG